MRKAVWWIKRDFRLQDNEALVRALAENDKVLPMFVFEPSYIAESDISPMHVWAWQRAGEDLQVRCRTLGGDLLLVTGGILKVLERLRKRWGYQALYSHEETGNGWTYKRDLAVKEWCEEFNIGWHEYTQNGVIRRLKKREDRQPIIRERLFETAPYAPPLELKFPEEWREVCEKDNMPSLNRFFNLIEYPEIKWDHLQPVSETQAETDLASFLEERGRRYSGGISSPNTAFTFGSRLSVHLAWGTLSVRRAFFKTYEKLAELKEAEGSGMVKQWRRSLRAFESRLHWRDHFIQRLESTPEMEYAVLNPAYAKVEYENDAEKLKAWQEGQTGFPMIDACMRCLSAVGFMNFRMRSMVVSFACFGLHLDWRVIHPHLAQVFLDYEPGIHFSQLQMQAGVVGINTIRVYSPTKQITDQDPKCIFIKKWIPELRSFTVEEILAYETATLGEYRKPVVNFKENSKLMKDQVYAIRKSLDGKKESRNVLKKHGSRKATRAVKKPKEDDSQLELF